jgi:PTS hybrid protein
VTVGLVIVSHSSKIADGVVELAAQMAGTVTIAPAGGTDDGGIGTSFDKVTEAIGVADDGDGVVVLCDLGSAILTAETALDFLDDEARARVSIADAPLVEGSVAAAVTAETGGDRAAVLAAAESANTVRSDGSEDEHLAKQATVPAADAVTGTATLVNRDGLHARPASEFVKLASGFDATVSVNGVDAKSLLRIMSLGLAAGAEVSVEAVGPDARAAVDALVELVNSGFGE